MLIRCAWGWQRGASANGGRSFGSLRGGSGINYGAAGDSMGFAGMAARLSGGGAGPEVLGTSKNPLITMQVRVWVWRCSRCCVPACLSACATRCLLVHIFILVGASKRLQPSMEIALALALPRPALQAEPTFKAQLWRTLRTLAVVFLLMSGLGALFEDRGLPRGILNNPDMRPQYESKTKFADVKGCDEAKVRGGATPFLGVLAKGLFCLKMSLNKHVEHCSPKPCSNAHGEQRSMLNALSMPGKGLCRRRVMQVCASRAPHTRTAPPSAHSVYHCVAT